MTTVQDAQGRSVQEDASVFGNPLGGGTMPGAMGIETLVLNIASVADDITPWGLNPKLRDSQLRAFWPTEEMMAGVVYSTAARNSSFNFALRGPSAVTNATMRMLQEADFGAGWVDLIMKVTVDLLTQDNGAFIEMIRPEDKPESPVIGIAHMDAWRCRRTGIWETPVVYTDRQGREHLLKWYNVISLSEFPSPIEIVNGLQYCAMTRVLRMAQTARDISIYQREKVSGRFSRAIHLVSGFSKQTIDDQIRLAQMQADNQGTIRYIQPIVISNPDPEANVQHIMIDLASLPDNFDSQVFFHQYVAKLSLGFGVDYQDIAPLPGGNLGTSTQSRILHLKSRGKGPALFMKMLEHKLNYQGAIPNNVHFEYAEKDVEYELTKSELMGAQARAVKAIVDSFTDGKGMNMPVDGIREVAAQVLNDLGILRPEYLELLGVKDSDPSKVINSSESVDVASTET